MVTVQQFLLERINRARVLSLPACHAVERPAYVEVVIEDRSRKLPAKHIPLKAFAVENNVAANKRNVFLHFGVVADKIFKQPFVLRLEPFGNQSELYPRNKRVVVAHCRRIFPAQSVNRY